MNLDNQLTELNAELPSEHQLQSFTTEELKKSFQASLGVSVKLFEHMANVWRELDRRGENMDEFRKGAMLYIEMIANKRLMAELAFKYVGQRGLLNALANLPLRLQSKLAKDDVVDVVTNNNGEAQSEKLKLSEIPAQQLSRVFRDGAIRSVSEQKELIKRSVNIKAKTRPRTIKKVEVQDNALVVGRTRIDIDSALAALSEHYGVDIK
ncbi:hypothetical protein N480_10635 [Pseudoalteromonas luteoviolacea S2607]|uniref:hypothetical protein n=1 Tax=Pseudoalteromonas luteoviolacea TaxID=43657 RepID=UPI0007B09411|nr:hypothetical protein [Pseudoalteromonas luteoviolacea]KZN28541.1 hypothetical protein N480_10635 [Pseudoalteromonas luteoviolacea S2607]